MRFQMLANASAKSPNKSLSTLQLPPALAPGVFFCVQTPQIRRMSLKDRAAELEDEFAFLDDWETRYAHIIDLGKANPPLGEHERSEETRVRGCASQVWMVISPIDDGKIDVRAESDALIVSGLIALLVALYSGASREEILAFDARAFFDKIGVTGTLSAQRSNGLASMLERINLAAASPAPIT